MTRKHKKRTSLVSATLRLRSLVFVAAFATIGAAALALISAATTYDPYGFADYCTLENSKTVIYGWGSDYDEVKFTRTPTDTSLPKVRVVVAGQSQEVSTNRANYREAYIDNYLQQRGIPPSDVYGFRAEFTNLYKGSSPTISGTLFNAGNQGINQPLAINTGPSIDGTSLQFFAGNKIPDACLTPLPVVQSPPPSQPSLPAQPPTQPPAQPSPTSARPRSPTSTPAPVPVPIATPTVSITPDGTVTAGTLAVSLQVAKGTAANLQITYGEVPANLSTTTPVTPVAGDTTTITLAELNPSTTYHYKIIRLQADGSAVASEIATFTTKGYELVFRLTDGDQPLAGLNVEIAELALTSTTNENGQIIIPDASTGIYTLGFTYKNQPYMYEAVFGSEDASEEARQTARVAVLSANIDVSQLTPVQPPATNNSKIGLIFSAIALVFLLAGGIIFWLIRRKRQRAQATPDYPFSSMYPPSAPVPLSAPAPSVTQSVAPPAVIAPAPVAPQPAPQPVAPQSQPPTQPQPLPADHASHSGESLKDLVIRDLREQAVRSQAAQAAKETLPKKNDA